MDPKSKSFQALQKKWYGKLKKSGFDDIEQDEDRLKIWTSHFFKSRYNEIVFKSKEDYYRLAGQFLNDYLFASKTERLIWEMHAAGTSIREIVRTLKERNIKAYKNQVHQVVQRLTNEMITKNVNR